MKFNYLKEENSIEIKDDLKSHYFALKLMFVIVIPSQILQLFNYKDKAIDGLFVIFAFLTVIMAMLFMYFQLKKTTKSKFELSEIESIKGKFYTGRRSYKLKLKNGKERDLDQLSKTEILALKELLSDIQLKA